MTAIIPISISEEKRAPSPSINPVFSLIGALSGAIGFTDLKQDTEALRKEPNLGKEGRVHASIRIAYNSFFVKSLFVAILGYSFLAAGMSMPTFSYCRRISALLALSSSTCFVLFAIWREKCCKELDKTLDRTTDKKRTIELLKTEQAKGTGFLGRRTSKRVEAAVTNTIIPENIKEMAMKDAKAKRTLYANTRRANTVSAMGASLTLLGGILAAKARGVIPFSLLFSCGPILCSSISITYLIGIAGAKKFLEKKSDF